MSSFEKNLSEYMSNKLKEGFTEGLITYLSNQLDMKPKDVSKLFLVLINAALHRIILPKA